MPDVRPPTPSSSDKLAEEIIRYHMYIDQGIEKEHIAPFNDAWYEAAQERIQFGSKYLEEHVRESILQQAYEEMNEMYFSSVKR